MASPSLNPRIVRTAAARTVTGYEAAKAFDGNTATSWRDGGQPPCYLEVEFDFPVKLDGYGIVCTDTARYPTSMNLQGLTDTGGWMSLDNTTFSASQPGRYPVSVPQAFKTYRLDFGGAAEVSVAELVLYGPDSVVPPMDLTADLGVTIGNNDAFADAKRVVIPTAGATYTSATFSNTGYSMQPGEPAGGFRSAWWQYTPAADGVVTLDNQQGSGDLVLYVFTGLALDSLVQVGYDDDSGGSATSRLVLNVTAGTTYWIRVGSLSDTNCTYALRATGPQGVPFGVAMTPMALEAQLRAGKPVAEVVDLPGFDLETTATGRGGRLLTAASPGVDFYASLPVPGLTRAWLVLLDPADTTLVPFVRPVLTVQVQILEGSVSAVTVEVQHSTTADFTAPITQTVTVTVLPGPNVVRVPVTQPLTDGAVYYWRARQIVAGITGQWLAARRFTVDRAAGDHTAQVAWNVTSLDTDPHLWFVTPTAGVPGDTVTIVGQGFSYQRGTVTLAGVQMPVQRWTHVPAYGQVFTEDRGIDAVTGWIDPEHDEVVVLVPDVAPPGGPLTVVDGTGSVPPDKAPPMPVYLPPVQVEPTLSADVRIGALMPPVPPIELESTVTLVDSIRPPDLGSNDTIAGATPVTVDHSGTYTLEPVSNAGFTVGGPWEPADVPGYRSAWWSIDVPVDGDQDVTFDASGSSGAVHIVLYHDYRDSGYGLLESGRAPLPEYSVFEPVTGYSGGGVPTRWLVRVSSDADIDLTYHLTITATLHPSPAVVSPGMDVDTQAGLLTDLVAGKGLMVQPTAPVELATEVDLRPPPTSGGGNDLMADATPITGVIPGGGAVTFPAISNVGFGDNEQPYESAVFAGYGLRSAWWVLTVPDGTAGSWDVTFDATGIGVDAWMDIVTVNPDGTLNDVAYNSPSVPTLTYQITAPGTYYLRVATVDDVDAQYPLTVYVTAQA